jgi:hypothetical protein
MPAIVYGKAFVIGQDKRLMDAVNSIEATSPMVGMYVAGVDDVYRWCTKNLVDPALNDALSIIDAQFGSWYRGATIDPP